MDRVKKVTAERIENEVPNSDRPVLVEFYTPWCPSCRAAFHALRVRPPNDS